MVPALCTTVIRTLGFQENPLICLELPWLFSFCSYKGWKETMEMIWFSMQLLQIIFPLINWQLARCICLPGYLGNMHDDLFLLLKIQAEITLWFLKTSMQRLERIIIYNGQLCQQGVWKEKAQRFILKSFFLEFWLSPTDFRVWIAAEKMPYRMSLFFWYKKPMRNAYSLKKITLSKTKISCFPVIKPSFPFKHWYMIRNLYHLVLVLLVQDLLVQKIFLV